MSHRIFSRAIGRALAMAAILGAAAFAFGAETGAKDMNATPPKDPSKIRVLIVGDSTVATLPARTNKAGWGQVFGEFFTDKVEVFNHAKSGRSSKSFVNEGLWDEAKTVEPDVVLIQFGHNDCPGKSEDRYTNAETDFRDYIRRYVDESRAMDARPILVTPMTRRRYANGKIRTILGPYAEGMKVVAKEKDVPLVDLHTISVEYFDKIGPEEAEKWKPNETDITHFTLDGARIICEMIVDNLPADCELVEYRKVDAE